MKSNVFFLISTLFLIMLSFCFQKLDGQELKYDSIIHAKNLSYKDGTISTYYSPACEKRAFKTLSLLQNVVHEYSDNDSTLFKFELAVLDSADMDGLNLPYGLFYSEGKMIIIPGDLTFEKCARIYNFSGFRDKLIERFLTLTNDPEELIVETFYTRIPVHELGHYYVDSILHVAHPDHFSSEITASYFMTDYLYRKDRRFFDAMNAYFEVLAKENTPKYRTIIDFDSKYYQGVGVQNYVWYHAIFQPMINDIYMIYKFDFMNTFAKTFPKTDNPKSYSYDEIIMMLDNMTSGKISKWIKVIESTSE